MSVDQWLTCSTIIFAVEEKIIVATTRPETMLGDTAIAVHPDDTRYTVSPSSFSFLSPCNLSLTDSFRPLFSL
jgi:valyl-tRNA synthetase